MPKPRQRWQMNPTTAVTQTNQNFPSVAVFKVPPGCKYVTLYVKVSAISGSEHSLDYWIDLIQDASDLYEGWYADDYAPDPQPYVTSVSIGGGALTTVTGLAIIKMGPGITGIANDTTGPLIQINTILTSAIGIGLYANGATNDNDATFLPTIEFS